MPSVSPGRGVPARLCSAVSGALLGAALAGGAGWALAYPLEGTSLVGSLVTAQRADTHINLPDLGHHGGYGGSFSLGRERALGDEIVRALYRSPDFLDDPLLNDYLQSLWQPLLQAARARGDIPPELAERFAWKLLLSRDRTVNAFALPGGYIGLHLGLLAISTSADEVVAVLAHELAHVSQRHIARLIERREQQAPWVLGAMILAALAANASRNTDIASAAVAGGQALALQDQLNFSRDMEREADRVGLGIMAEAGFDGRGFISLFEKLQAAARLNDAGAFPYLRTHPLNAERIADMQSRLLELGPMPGSDARTALAHQHALMAARARVLAETNPERLHALAQTLGAPATSAAPPDALGALYAATLAAARLRQSERTWLGLQQLQQAAAQLPAAVQPPALRWLELEALLLLPAASLGEPARARLAELQAAALQASERAALLLAAQASLLHAPQQQALAAARLQAHTSLHPRDALAWQTLASLHLAQQQPVRAARAEAEARLAQFDPQAALERLRAAQQLARAGTGAGLDHVELSILDARLRHVEGLVREQAAQRGR